LEKLAYLLSLTPETSGGALRTSLVEKTVPVLRAAGAMRIGLSVDDEEVASGAAVRIQHSEPPIRALVSFWMHNSDDRAPCEAALSEAAEELAGYLVVESRPLLHEPPVGARASGANLVTCIRRRADLSTAEFCDRWYNEHKTVALETQSTTGYVRNTVVRRLTAGGGDWDGIVEETFPIEALSDPKVFYAAASQEEFQANLARMIESCQRFLDFDPIETTHMSEYYLG